MVDLLLGQVGRLHSMALIGLPDLTDDSIARILEASSTCLHTLRLVNLPAGTSTMEALCSWIPDIRNLEITDSPILADIDLRCLASVCRNLETLTLQNCPRVSDVGFTRCQTLKRLRALDLRALSARCSARILRYFPGCTLQALIMDKMDFAGEDGEDNLTSPSPFRWLNALTCNSLEHLSVSRCNGLRWVDVTCALEMFPRMRTFSLTECDLPSRQLKELTHFNPFLQYMEDDLTEFKGFGLKGPTDQVRFDRFWARQKSHRRWRAARVLQRFRRRLVADREDRRKGRRADWEALKESYATLIQVIVENCYSIFHLEIPFFVAIVIVSEHIFLIYDNVTSCQDSNGNHDIVDHVDFPLFIQMKSAFSL